MLELELNYETKQEHKRTKHKKPWLGDEQGEDGAARSKWAEEAEQPGLVDDSRTGAKVDLAVSDRSMGGGQKNRKTK